MKNTINIILGVLFLSSIISLNAQDSSPSIASDTWTNLKANNYFIEYPDNWELNQTGLSGTLFFLISERLNDNDGFRENINLITQDLSGYDLDLQAFTELSKGQILKGLPGSVIISNETITSPYGGTYQKLIYTAPQDNQNLIFSQHFWVIGQMSYVLTFTAEEEQYARFQSTAEKIMESFIIEE